MVEEISLHRPSAERLVKMLAMDVEQHLAQRFQLLHRDRVAIDESA